MKLNYFESVKTLMGICDRNRINVVFAFYPVKGTHTIHTTSKHLGLNFIIHGPDFDSLIKNQLNIIESTIAPSRVLQALDLDRRIIDEYVQNEIEDEDLL